ncbi:hypothetical protein [Paenibacillus kribbensis]|uniref:hypothetical protein n=1 Tax=Paenibacillus kribbensis TaxID=172713 RepID=UPI002109CEC9|nr:hypothetical protein [Paenibacillus kribbensis]
MIYPDEVIEVLQKQYERVFMEKELAGEMYVDNDLVCCTNIGKQVFPNTITRLMKRKIEELELPSIRFHDLRHTSVSLMLSIGIHLLSKKEVSDPLEIEEKFCDQKRDQKVEKVAV